MCSRANLLTACCAYVYNPFYKEESSPTLTPITAQATCVGGVREVVRPGLEVAAPAPWDQLASPL